MSKLRIALISSYNEACANAAYTHSLEQALLKHFDVTIFDLKTAALLRVHGEENIKRADAYIDWICSQLKDFDIVNIHSELGLYGYSLEQINRRMQKLCDHSQNLIMTVHALAMSGDDFTETHTSIFGNMLVRPPSKPYHLIVHIKRDKETLINYFHLPSEKIMDFPVLFLSEKERKHYIETADPKAWKRAHGFQENDVLIGRFGFINAYKEYICGLKALTMLPAQYKMVFVGGQHPHTIEKFKVDPTIQGITNFIDDYDEKLKATPSYIPGQTLLLSDRVRFFGYVSNDELYQAVTNVDFALVAYHEAGQSASAATSLALELHRPCLLTYNFTFMEYDKYFPDCFEYFNIGNHYEIRDKILNFDFTKVARIQNYTARYTLDNLTLKYLEIFELMLKQVHTETEQAKNTESLSVQKNVIPIHKLPPLPSKRSTVRQCARYMLRPVYRGSRASVLLLFRVFPPSRHVLQPLIAKTKRVILSRIQ